MDSANVCLKCHTDPPQTWTLRDGNRTPSSSFVTDDASDAMGSHPGEPTMETSHNWATTDDTVAAAGASRPLARRFYGRYGISRGKITCTRCHNPHGADTSPKLLKIDNSADQYCLDCHRDWNQVNTAALETHPVGIDYAGFEGDTARFKSSSEIPSAPGDVRLVGGKVSCSSCHGLHFTDSNSTTADGMANYNSLAAGDGYILRSDGPERTGTTSAETAQLRSYLCQACHTYKTHGSTNEEMGCLGCHGGHSYNEGNPNYFVLRDQTSTATYNAVSGLDYTVLPKPHDGAGPEVWTVWADNTVGTSDGYCEKCHGDLETMPGSTRAHIEGENCRTCHEHNGTTATYSFEASGGCTGCHGYPPIENTAGGDPNAGYAVSGGNDYSTDTYFKDESLTPHRTHVNGSGDYSFSCGVCHANNSHDTGTFQDVFIAPTASLADGSGNLTPAYDPTASSGGNGGICSNVYCHSNGGARTGDASRTYNSAAIDPWENGLGALTTCDACHGNSAATMNGLNSDRHQQHVTSYDCNVCHVSTAASSIALAAGAIGGTHVDENRDVDFDTAYNLGAANLTEGVTPYDGNTGVCSVYCHSDGAGTFKSPDWDTIPAGTCIVCHNSDVASGSPMTTGSHGAHIDDADNEIGWDLGCVECHSNTVADNSTISNAANHVDGGKTLGISRDTNKTTCSNIGCHSDGNLDGTLTYKDPTWGTTLSGCDDCHGDGAGNAYPTYANGGAASVDANSHAVHVNSGITCGDCHSATSTAGSAIDGTTPTNHVNQAIDVAGADIGGWDGGTKTCSTVACHGGNSPVWGDTGLSCADCHLGTGDTDDFTYNNGTTAKVDSAEWGFSGHGLSSASTYEVTGRAGADFDAAASGATASACFYCHDGAVGHGDANLFRLKANGYGELNGNCLGCHATASAGVDPDGAGTDYAAENSAVKVDKYHYGAGHTSTTDGGRWCWDCHDPHGDASAVGVRIQMIQRNAGVNPDANGVPASLTTTGVVFTDNTIGAGVGGFARTSAPYGEGICNNCHTQTQNADLTARYQSSAHSGSHSTGKCTTCHQHSEDATYNGDAFQGSGCNGCHGSQATGQYWPDGSGGTPAYVDDQAGAHDRHILAIGLELGFGDYSVSMYTDVQQQEICTFCHADPGGSGHDTDSGDSRVDVYQDSDDGVGNTDVFKKWGPAAQDYASDVDGSVGSQAYNYTAATCSNLACHNRTATPVDWNTPPASPTCAVCHTGAGSSAGRHDSHVTTRGYDCTECHVDNGTYPTDTANLDHAEGTVQLDWTNTGSFEQTNGGGSVTYNGTLIYDDANFGTCASAACHTNVETPVFNAPLATPNNCSICHGNEPATGAHTSHLSGIYGPNLGTDCGGCHAANANNSDMTGHDATHVNGSVTFSDAATLGTTAACSACHGGSTPAGTAKANWPTAVRVSCESCHGDYADAVVGGKTAPHMAGTGAGEYTASGHGKTGVAQGCAACHDQNDAGHMDGVSGDDTRLIATLNGQDYAADPVAYCADACHATTMTLHYTNGASGTSFPADGAMDCQTCHNQHGQNLDADGLALDTMIRPVIDGKNVVAIYNSATRSSYYIDPPNSGADTGQWGICQACHDPTDASAGDGAIDNFNRTTANPGHYSGVCTSCHKHDDATVAFKPSGCNGCHGDATNGNFWPDTAGTSAVDYPDRAGLHMQHVDAIGDEINGGGAGIATLDDKNASCVYCHPDPGGNNVDGASHDTATVGSPVSTPDLHKDGWNSGTSYTNLQGGVDADGTYAPTIKRCSTVDCHSNGEFTWTWYPDVLAPAAVADLTAATGTEPGTVDLTWTAPANDGSNGPNAYHYEVRYSTSAINDSNWASATIAGGPPSTTRRGKVGATTMKADGLTPGNTYYFAVKTSDENDNWSPASNSVSAVANADDQAPVFWGINSATTADEPGTVYLEWDAAPDHTLPVTYTIYYDTGVIDYGGDDQVATTQGTNYRVTGLPGGIVYNFAVRASDAVTPTPNTDSNTIVVQQLAKPVPELSKTPVEYFTSGTTALQTGTYGTANSSSLGAGGTRTWAAPAYAVDTKVYGTNFFVRFMNNNETTGGEVTAELGYLTGGSTWNSFTPAVTAVRTVPPNFDQVRRLGFGGGGFVPATAQLAVRLTNSGGLAYTVATGSATNRGDIVVDEQLYNHLPSAVSFSPQPSGSGIVTISWGASSDADGHTIHYDVYGSDDGGVTYDYVIATGLPESTTNVQWDTVDAGIALGAANNQIKVKVLAGDGYESGDGTADHTPVESLSWTVDNTVDTIAPGQITNLAVETRPKAGTVYLTWTAPGDDGYTKTRAAQYDIRYSTAAITSNADFTSATPVTSEPVPAFGGTPQGFEVLDLVPDTTYHFAIKAADEQGNWSTLSNSASAAGGRKCGICHGTPPEDPATAGNHLQHGYTVADCVKCHGEEVVTYGIKDYNAGIRHQDGLLQLGFGYNSSGVKLDEVVGEFTGDTITYYQDPDGAGPEPSYKIYEDASSGGFTVSPGGDQIDNGTCFNFTSLNASGCHGPATPSWDENASLSCADCHGDTTRTVDPYGRDYDATTDNGGIVPPQIEASPPLDNHGYQGLQTDPVEERRYVGQHEKHLNYSYRYSKGSNCRMCHKDNNHADGIIDIQYDSGAGENAAWTPYNSATSTPGSCSGTSGLTCHGTLTTPNWDSAEAVDCVNCHGFDGVTPDHVTDPAMGVSAADSGWATDPMPGNCTYCHPAGHPRGEPPNTVLIPNNVFVGIEFSGDGIHLHTDIGGRGPYSSEAEICWGCHDSNSISEWGTNTKAATGSSPYDYGSVSTSNWTTATWTSGTAAFGYKTDSIQSTHATNSAGSSAVTYNAAAGPYGTYEESPDAVANIRCTNCHDVHNRNMAQGDTMTGAPYLRGTWMGNPYPEDGAPQAGTIYTGQTLSSNNTYTSGTVGFGEIPRGGTQYNETGGYHIDQNNNFPTKGWTVESSAGLCTLCHGTDVDVLDQNTGENLWLSTNGHSNATLGGTGVNAANIFDYSHGRPTPVMPPLGSENSSISDRINDMASQNMCAVAGDTDYPAWYRGNDSTTFTPRVLAGMSSESIDCFAFDWGVVVDDTTTDKGYHQFSCSKCHNPHASRLPKLMITNCLDIRHNTWDDDKESQTWHSGNVDYNKEAAYFTSAQNCHRRDSSRNPANYDDPINGGWNKVTPW